MYYLAIIALIFLGIRLGIALINLLGKSTLRTSTDDSDVLVSVLIPARNEANNIEELLSGLSKQSHPKLEILVYDDASEDQTLAIVNGLARQDPRIHSISGARLPEGWLGKNHACHRLAEKASGQFLLFLDADVRVIESLVNDLLRHLRFYNLNLVSVFPVQQMLSLGEKLSVPLMNHILLSFLPLILTRLSRRPSLSAANGQCMMFDAATYQAHWFHARVRSEAVEDIRIMQEMKSLGLKTEVLLSDGQIECRMYHRYGDALRGFARNFHHFFGKNDVAMLAYGVWTSMAPFISYLGFGFNGLLIYISGTLTLRITTALASQQPVLSALLLSPLQHIAMLHIMINAIWRRRKGNLIWKGRRI